MKKILALSILITTLSSVFAQKVPGIFLQDNGWLWSENEKGVMVAKVKLSEGTEIDVYPESKDSSYDGGSKPLNFTKVSYDSKDYWAISNRFVTGKKLGVLTKDVAFYKEPHPATIFNATLDKLSIVAIGDKVKSYAADSLEFTEVSYYSPSRYRVQTVYIYNPAYTTSSDDILAFKTILRADELNNVDQQRTILESALKLKVSSDVKALIQDLISDLDYLDDLSAGGTEIYPENAPVKIKTDDGSKINIRDVPGFNGQVVGQLEDGTSVIVGEITRRQQKIDGIRAPWYEIYDSETKDYLGWVFGGYVDSEAK